MMLICDVYVRSLASMFSRYAYVEEWRALNMRKLQHSNVAEFPLYYQRKWRNAYLIVQNVVRMKLTMNGVFSF